MIDRRHFIDAMWAAWHSGRLDDDHAVVVDVECGLRRSRLLVSVTAHAGVLQRLTLTQARGITRPGHTRAARPTACIAVDYHARGDTHAGNRRWMYEAGWPENAVRMPVAKVRSGDLVRSLDDAEIQLATLALLAMNAHGENPESGALRGKTEMAGGIGRWHIRRRRARPIAPGVTTLPGVERVVEVGIGVTPWQALAAANSASLVLNDLFMVPRHGDGLPTVVLECRSDVERMARDIMGLGPIGIVADRAVRELVVALATRRGFRFVAKTTPRDAAVKAFYRRRAELSGYHAVIVQEAGSVRLGDPGSRVILCCLPDSLPPIRCGLPTTPSSAASEA